jgi:hypothetical protein
VALAAGQRLTAALLNGLFGTSASDSQPTQGTTTSTSYTATLTGGTACGVAFVAPASGKVTVHSSATLLNSTTGLSYVSFEIRAGGSIGSGTLFLAASDANAVQHVSTSVENQGKGIQVTGLVPGAVYNCRQMFKVGTAATTSTFNNKHLSVNPDAA